MTHHEFDASLAKLERRLPNWASGMLRYFVDSSAWVRVPPAIALFLLGFVGFLPVLGFWMIPLGLVLLAQDIPLLRRPIARALDWLDSKLPEQKGAE